MLLAIDTATRHASLALYNAEGVLAETSWHSRENHTVETMTQIVRLLELAQVRQGALQAIGVALGPGSFTGLRVGLSIAKGLAYGNQIPLLGIPTLEAVAHAHAWQSLPIWAILAAGRGRYAMARYIARRGAVKRVSDYALVDVDGLIELVTRANAAPHPSRALFAGEVDAALAQRLAERFGTRAVIESPAHWARRAGFLAELAWARLQRGEADDVATLAPMYAPFKIANA